MNPLKRFFCKHTFKTTIMRRQHQSDGTELFEKKVKCAECNKTIHSYLIERDIPK